jgi:hypothetical protein
MFHILLGFENHRKDSASQFLYSGTDSARVKELVDENLDKFGIIRLYKNPSPSKRFFPATSPEEVHHFPEEVETPPEANAEAEAAAEILRLTQELAQIKKDLADAGTAQPPEEYPEPTPEPEPELPVTAPSKKK